MSRESLLLLLFCSIFIDFDDDLKLVFKLVPGRKEEDLIDDDDDDDDDDFDDDENKDELRREAFITTAFIAAVAVVHINEEDILYRVINYAYSYTMCGNTRKNIRDYIQNTHPFEGKKIDDKPYSSLTTLN